MFFALRCSPAVPNQGDLERVRSLFLELRFNAVLMPTLREKNDSELFELSCRANRVNCMEVLELLKKEDPAFHKKLKGK